MCCLYTWHLLLLSILERDLRLLLSWRFLPFFPCERFLNISWEFFLIRCEVLGQGCRMCTECTALWGKFGMWYWTIQNKLNWIENKSLNSWSSASSVQPLLIKKHWISVIIVDIWGDDEANRSKSVKFESIQCFQSSCASQPDGHTNDLSTATRKMK